MLREKGRQSRHTQDSEVVIKTFNKSLSDILDLEPTAGFSFAVSRTSLSFENVTSN